MCVYAFMPESNVHCGSALGPGTSGLLYYYCTPLVHVPTVNGGLAVWLHNNKRNQIKKEHHLCAFLMY